MHTPRMRLYSTDKRGEQSPPKEKDMKLSKAQMKVIEWMKYRIDDARNNDIKTWAGGNWDYIHHPGYLEKLEKLYEEERNGIVGSIRCNSKTLTKLEELGLIEIIYDSNGEHDGVDKAKLLNY